MKKTALLILLLASVLYATDLLILKGIPGQGALLSGEVSDLVESVFLNYEPVPIHNNRFLIGFDMKAKSNQVITLTEIDGSIHDLRIDIDSRKYDVDEITSARPEFQPLTGDHDLAVRIESENRKMSSARSRIDPERPLMAYQFRRPLYDGRITTPFGYTRIVNGRTGSSHNGIDIALPTGTPVKAMANGEVVLADHFYYNGSFVLLDHGGALTSVYLHLDKLMVQAGQQVNCGDVIGTLGDTGRSTGPHLHWGIRWRGFRIDPESLEFLDNIYLTLREDD